MKNFNKLYISLILLSSSLLAVDKSYSFLGIQAGSSFSQSNTTPTVGLKYGIQTKKYRTSLIYSHGKKSKSTYDTFIVQMDTGILSNTFKNSAFKPYAGFSFGAMQEKNVLNALTKDSGYVYGINTGLAYIFNDAIDFDLGYRFLKTSKLESIDSLSDLTLSMHYFY